MKRYLSPSAALAIIATCILFSVSSYGEIDTPRAGNPDLSVFTSGKFGFSVSVPRRWRKSEFNLQYKHIMILAGPGGARVKITATVNDDEEKQTWANWKDWYAGNQESEINTITESKTLKYDKNGSGTLYVFESYQGSKRFLVRLLLINLETSLMAIECSAPINEFYRNTGIFDTVMSSLKFGVAEGK
jgi:hypothetical protein